MKVINAIAHVLKCEGVESLIGYPVNPIIEGAAEADIRTIMVRQERIGLHMCDAIAKVTSGDKIGVFVMQHGPGTENAFGGVAQSFGDSVPVVVLPAGYARNINQVHPNFNAALNFRNVTKLSEQVTVADATIETLRRAYTTVKNGRPWAGAGRISDRHPARGNSRRARRRVQKDAAPQERPRPAIGFGDRRGAGCGPAAGHRRRAGHPLRQGLGAAESLGRAARSAGHDDPAGQERLPGKPPALARLGRHRHRCPSVAHAAEGRLHLRHRLQLHRTTSFGTPRSKGQAGHPRDARPLDINKDVPSEWPLVGDARLTLGALLVEVREAEGQAARPAGRGHARDRRARKKNGSPSGSG
jgi:thiamine pyrophosphate-dependent acetolactate synthase large subunit-like protein